MSQKILLCDNIDLACESIFESQGYEVERSEGLDKPTLHKKLQHITGIVVRSATKIDKPFLDHCKKLKIIGRAGVGVDNINIEEASKRGIMVVNTPDGNTLSTAEHTIGMILSLIRNIPLSMLNIHNQRWERKKFLGNELEGKHVGIVGLGKIGSAVAQRLRGFDVIMQAYDPYATHEKAQSLGVKLVEIDELFKNSDILTVHTPLTAQTKHLISKKMLDKLKKGIFLINCARGGIICETDIPDMLDSGIVGGIALDVYSQEPPTPELYQILKHPKVLSTTHLGASTKEAQEKSASQVAHHIINVLQQKNYQGVLNAKSIDILANPEALQFLELTTQLGQLIYHLIPEHQQAFQFEYTGKCAKYATSLTDALLSIILQKQLTENINLVNARYWAERRGIAITETTTETSSYYQDLISIKWNKNADYHSVSATRLEHHDNRVIEINGYPLDFSLSGKLLIYQNIDKPGMLAAASSIMANKNINIAALSLGRHVKNDKAITVFHVDNALQDKEMNLINTLDGVSAVKQIHIKKYDKNNVLN